MSYLSVFEPVVYCRCGNTCEYGKWQLATVARKTIRKYVRRHIKSLPVELCPICIIFKDMAKLAVRISKI